MTGRGIDGAVFMPWTKCDCGKRHTCAGISQGTRCSCGRRLWARAFDPNAKQDLPPTNQDS